MPSVPSALATVKALRRMNGPRSACGGSTRLPGTQLERTANRARPRTWARGRRASSGIAAEAPRRHARVTPKQVPTCMAKYRRLLEPDGELPKSHCRSTGTESSSKAAGATLQLHQPDAHLRVGSSYGPTLVAVVSLPGFGYPR